MERVNSLIEKLQQQLEQKAGAEKLLLTVQMLYGELASKIATGETRESDKVVVIMPAVPKQNHQSYNVSTEAKEPVLEEEEKIIEVLQVDEKEIEEELEEIKRNAEAKNQMSVNAKPSFLFRHRHQ